VACGLLALSNMLDRKKGFRRIEGHGPKPQRFDAWTSRFGLRSLEVRRDPWRVLPHLADKSNPDSPKACPD